jgi:PTH1 family peptidyl-tRNA hydrolase
MWLIVGLGNPGTRYRDTPHNAGFVVCDRFAERHHLGEESKRFRGRFRRGRVGTEDVALLKPETYMNLSGESVAEAVRYLPLEAENVIVVFDDMDIPGGSIRIRPRGGSGGHNGIQSVIEHLGTRDFARLRVGVGRPPREGGAVRHLLGRLGGNERKVLFDTVDLAVRALDTVLEAGIDEAMNRYNGLSAIGSEEEEEDKA